MKTRATACTVNSEAKASRHYIRKPWSKLISAEQFGAMMREYEAGATTHAMCEKYGVSRSWLYKERKKWIENDRPRDDVICLKAEIAQLKEVIARLTVAKLLNGELHVAAKAS